jgi:hypothetical protein
VAFGVDYLEEVAARYSCSPGPEGVSSLSMGMIDVLSGLDIPFQALLVTKAIFIPWVTVCWCKRAWRGGWEIVRC